MSKKLRLRLPNKVLEYADIDYLHKLSESEREYMMQFIDGYYNNNHRKYDLFKKVDYDNIKKHIHDMTNSRNRCSYSNNYARNSLVELDSLIKNDDSADGTRLDTLLKEVNLAKDEEDLLTKIGLKTFKDLINELITATVDEIHNPNKDNEKALIRFYTIARKIIKNETKIIKNDKRIEKDKLKG